MPRYIERHALEKLHTYKYSGVDKSILSRFALNPFWNWLVTLWPKWVAPNTITLTGLTMVFINFLTLLAYDPTYLSEKGNAPGPPNWVYFTWSIGLFIYQSLDAIDGKQARRTGMSGPLGEMFDHGCDAINTTLEVLLCCQAINLGRSWWTISSIVATTANFYLTTWEEYHTGSLFLGVFSGPVEGIIIIVAMFAITGIKGPAFWDTGILTVTGLKNVDAVRDIIPNTPLNEAFMYFGAAGLLFNIASSYLNVIRARRAKKQSVFTPLAGLFPFVALTIQHILWMYYSKYADGQGILESSAFLPFVCAWGLQFAHNVGRMILAHVTHQPFPMFDVVNFVSIVGLLDALLPARLGRRALLQTTPERTSVFVWLAFAISALTYARFVILVIGDITEYLGIACLTVRKKDANGQWRNADEVEKEKRA